MCLACEMEELWYAEAQARAREDELSAGHSSPLAGVPSSLFPGGERSTPSDSEPADEGGPPDADVGSPSPGSLRRARLRDPASPHWGEVKEGASGVVPQEKNLFGGEVKSPQRGEVRKDAVGRFVCEETSSE
jgi:hypothetical protein